MTSEESYAGQRTDHEVGARPENRSNLETRTPRESVSPLRTTFVSGQEIARRARERMSQVVRQLEPKTESETTNERLALFRESLRSLGHEIELLLIRFEQEAPEEAKQQRKQYSVAVPRDLFEGRGPAQELGAEIRWAIDLVQELITRFTDLAESARNDVARETYRSLVDLMLAYQKRIARLSEGQHDL